MTSLRSRLILGSSLIAVVPLALAIYLLSQRVEAMVTDQASERLSAALGGLEAELRADADEVGEKLRILAADATLKRLYLVRPTGGRDLFEFLAEKRFLLGLDFLRVSDTSRVVVAAAEMRGVAPVESLAPAHAPAMTARSPILYQSEAAGFLEGGLSLDAGFLQRLKQTRGVDLVLRDAGGNLVATTLDLPTLPAVGEIRDVARFEVGGHSYLSRSFPLQLGAGAEASVTGLIPTSSADRTIAGLQIVAALLGLFGVAIAVALGVLWSTQISGPVERLAAFSHRLSHGDWDQPLELESVRELQTLVAALERMRGDLRRYRDQLVVSERHAAWSQMARKVAHEVKNPLTPIAVSVADLKRSFDQRRPDFPQILDQAVRTIGEEVESLKHLLNEFSEFARFPAPRFALCDLSALMADLEALYTREVAQGRLAFSDPKTGLTLSADASQLRQALVNLIKNGLEALDGSGRVTVSAAVENAGLEIVVTDTGRGLTAEQRANLFVPGFTTKASGSGLGLAIVERIVNDHRGTITADAGEAGGTTFRIHLPLEPRS
jgi:two-component system nitrogen regulation sensor histidine kinase NtrY